MSALSNDIHSLMTMKREEYSSYWRKLAPHLATLLTQCAIVCARLLDLE